MDVVSVMAGVVVAFATDPANPLADTTETLETVPPPESPSHALKSPADLIKLVSPCVNFIFAPPQIVGCAAAAPAKSIRAKIKIFFIVCLFFALPLWALLIVEKP
jgi:hypothetical protein